MAAPKYIGFVPGLEGGKSVMARTNDTLPGTYAHAVKTAADELGLPFYRLDFQKASSIDAEKFPTLSQMGVEIAEGIKLLNWHHSGTGLVVASSIGAGAYLQSLLKMQDDGTEYPESVFFKPGIDPLLLIAVRLKQAGVGHWIDELMNGQRETIEIPVDPSPQNPNPGTFIITAKHYTDADAQRIISSESSRNNFWDKFSENKLPQVRVLTASDDPMFTAQIADIFARVMAGCTVRYQLDTLPGSRADDHGPDLTRYVKEMAQDRRLANG